MKIQQQNPACSVAVPYAELMARGLIAFADSHVEYGRWLAGLIATHATQLADDTSPAVAYPGTYVLPHTEHYAVRRAYWLLDTIAHRRIPGHGSAGAVLRQWSMARAHDEPKAVVLGIQYGVLNYGIIGHPPKRHEPMGVLIRDDVLRNDTGVALGAQLTMLTNNVVEQGLLLANGSTSRLEPELGDWLFGDKKLAIYRTAATTLEDIRSHLESIGAPHAYHGDAHGIALLAHTPALYAHDLPGHEGLEAVEVA